jgi:hypothetical protein
LSLTPPIDKRTIFPGDDADVRTNSCHPNQAGSLMWDFSVSRSLGLMARTMPFILLRVAVYFGIAAAYVIVTGTGAGIGWGVGALGDESFQAGSVFWGGTIGFGLTASVIYFLREYILYVVKAGHIAVLVELLDGREMPEGKSQVTYATLRPACCLQSTSWSRACCGLSPD